MLAVLQPSLCRRQSLPMTAYLGRSSVRCVPQHNRGYNTKNKREQAHACESSTTQCSASPGTDGGFAWKARTRARRRISHRGAVTRCVICLVRPLNRFGTTRTGRFYGRPTPAPISYPPFRCEALLTARARIGNNGYYAPERICIACDAGDMPHGALIIASRANAWWVTRADETAGIVGTYSLAQRL